jgi:hypothetical protein
MVNRRVDEAVIRQWVAPAEHKPRCRTERRGIGFAALAHGNLPFAVAGASRVPACNLE